MNDTEMIFSMPAKFRKLREICSYSPEYVAFQLGISVGRYIKIENGRTEITLLETGKVGELYNLSLLQMIGLSVNELILKMLQNTNS